MVAQRDTLSRFGMEVLVETIEIDVIDNINAFQCNIIDFEV